MKLSGTPAPRRNPSGICPLDLMTVSMPMLDGPAWASQAVCLDSVYVPVQLEDEGWSKGDGTPRRLGSWSETLEERTPTLERRREGQTATPTLDRRMCRSRKSAKMPAWRPVYFTGGRSNCSRMPRWRWRESGILEQNQDQQRIEKLESK